MKPKRSRPSTNRSSRPAHRSSNRPSGRPDLPQTCDLQLPSSVPTLSLRAVRFHPFIYKKMVSRPGNEVQSGDLVEVKDPRGERFGYGYYNSRSEIALRMVTFGDNVPDESFWNDRIDAAVSLRHDLLGVRDTTTAYRIIHSEADGFPGLVVDRFGDVLSAEVFSIAMYRRCEEILRKLARVTGCSHYIATVDPQIQALEGFYANEIRTDKLPQTCDIDEFGTRFRVNLVLGHKTGYFCDQRENRKRLAEWATDKDVLDLCCYSGGFSIQAKKLGRAANVTGVDLDERAISQAQKNANLNQVKAEFVHADSFSYMRDMIKNERRYDVVILDPPKLIRNRRELEDGTRAHFDLNRLAVQLVRPGGLFLTCSCSGLLGRDEFERVVQSAARRGAEDSGHLRRRLQIIDETGAAGDHPVSADCLETRYLTAIWARVVQ